MQEKKNSGNFSVFGGCLKGCVLGCGGLIILCAIFVGFLYSWFYSPLWVTRGNLFLNSESLVYLSVNFDPKRLSSGRLIQLLQKRAPDERRRKELARLKDSALLEWTKIKVNLSLYQDGTVLALMDFSRIFRIASLFIKGLLGSEQAVIYHRDQVIFPKKRGSDVAHREFINRLIHSAVASPDPNFYTTFLDTKVLISDSLKRTKGIVDQFSGLKKKRFPVSILQSDRDWPGEDFLSFGLVNANGFISNLVKELKTKSEGEPDSFVSIISRFLNEEDIDTIEYLRASLDIRADFIKKGDIFIGGLVEVLFDSRLNEQKIDNYKEVVHSFLTNYAAIFPGFLHFEKLERVKNKLQVFIGLNPEYKNPKIDKK